jgi:predicted RNase H-like HicB family nuclease
MRRYLVVIEKTDDGYSAYAPDVPGVATVGDTVEDTLENMQEALELYFEVAIERSQSLPPVSAVQAGFIEVDEAKFAAKAMA